MIKIHSLYVRDQANPRLVSREIDPECQWVLDGEGTPTVKWDGTACLVWHGIFYKRHTVKAGDSWPPFWVHHSFDHNVLEGPGWVPVGSGPEDQYHVEAWEDRLFALESQTFELVGPKVQGNPYGLESHQLRQHGADVIDLSKCQRGFDAYSVFLRDAHIEGVVWHHPDGRMAKLKRRDFGYSWPE